MTFRSRNQTLMTSRFRRPHVRNSASRGLAHCWPFLLCFVLVLLGGLEDCQPPTIGKGMETDQSKIGGTMEIIIYKRAVTDMDGHVVGYRGLNPDVTVQGEDGPVQGQVVFSRNGKSWSTVDMTEPGVRSHPVCDLCLAPIMNPAGILCNKCQVKLYREHREKTKRRGVHVN